jgi:hypothetical protein
MSNALLTSSLSRLNNVDDEENSSKRPLSMSSDDELFIPPPPPPELGVDASSDEEDDDTSPPPPKLSPRPVLFIPPPPSPNASMNLTKLLSSLPPPPPFLDTSDTTRPKSSRTVSPLHNVLNSGDEGDTNDVDVSRTSSFSPLSTSPVPTHVASFIEKRKIFEPKIPVVSPFSDTTGASKVKFPVNAPFASSGTLKSISNKERDGEESELARKLRARRETRL